MKIHKLFITPIIFIILFFADYGFLGYSSSKILATTHPDLILGRQYPAELVKCVDGDTAHFNIDGTIYKTRFLFIDTPESTNEIEPFGKEASDFTCSYLKKGAIMLETDGSNLFDKYDRLLAWIWVDGTLLQEDITKAGLVKDFYDYGEYKYEDQITTAMRFAKEDLNGMYGKETKTSVIRIQFLSLTGLASLFILPLFLFMIKRSKS